MGRIVAGIGTSHVPSIGGAYDRGKTALPAWKPLFDAYVPVRKWLKELRPDVCIRTQLALATGPKIEVATGSPVTSVRQDRDHVVVTTGEAEYRADKAIVSAGAGAAKLLGAPFEELLNPVSVLWL